MSVLASTGEHAADVLSRLRYWQDQSEPCALVVVTSTEGGAVRAPGALMAVNGTDLIGYISGGCIDEDVALQARAAISDAKAKALRYGAGSPFVDLPLPCGGAIEVLILPDPNPEIVKHALSELDQRRAIALRFELDGTISEAPAEPQNTQQALHFEYHPKLRLRIAGRGADPLALATIAQAAGYGVQLQCVDEADIALAEAAGISQIEKLDTPTSLTLNQDDAWTAFVLMFHDGAWEIPLLKQALAGPAFYIGAVGSQRTHQARCENLRDAGVSNADVDRVRGPIGLVPSLRDASMLAVSTLAEIIEAFPARSIAKRPQTALLLLAAGQASRFEAGDKLLADLNGRSVLEHSATIEFEPAAAYKLAIVSDSHPERSEVLSRLGWTLLSNPDAHLGQSTSLTLGLTALTKRSDIDQVIVVLADMPNIPSAHYRVLLKAAEPSAITAVISEAEGVMSPPALFKRQHFETLSNLTGDQGAKAIFKQTLGSGATVSLAPRDAMDVDTVQDLESLKETAHA